MKATDSVPNGTKPVACVVDGCDRTRKARGLCAKHYARQRRTGDPNAVRRAGRPPHDTNARLRDLFKGEMSARSIARYAHAMRLYGQLDAYGLTPTLTSRQAIARATRPDGTFNVAKFEAIAGSQLVFCLLDAGLLADIDDVDDGGGYVA